jgi:hypothetical protein
MASNADSRVAASAFYILTALCDEEAGREAALSAKPALLSTICAALSRPSPSCVAAATGEPAAGGRPGGMVRSSCGAAAGAVQECACSAQAAWQGVMQLASEGCQHQRGLQAQHAPPPPPQKTPTTTTTTTTHPSSPAAPGMLRVLAVAPDTRLRVMKPMAAWDLAPLLSAIR